MTANLQPWNLAVLILALAFLVMSGADPMPHVSECRLCHKCHLTDVPPNGRRLTSLEADVAGGATAKSADSAATGARRTLAQARGGDGGAAAQQAQRKRREPVYDADLDPTVPLRFKPSSYKPKPQGEMAEMAVCQECYGCLHNLTHINEVTKFMNNTYASEMGATSSWIFRSNTNATPSGVAVVKVYCLPVPKRVGAQLATCNPGRIAEVMKQLMAIDAVSRECGFTDLVPRMWLAPVLGVVPGVGYPINWWGLWMEFVEGISLENLLYRGTPKRLSMETIADIFNNQLNKTRLVRGAIFDLLTSQCDRHAQNLLVQEDGNIKLIDNESCLQHMWRQCGFDSVMVPTTQKQEIVRLANHFVLKLPTATGGAGPPRTYADPQLTLDYRCHLPDGREQMGTTFPPEIDTCLRRIAGMTPKQVRAYFDFPDVRVANNLLTRATDMITRGFEWAAKYGQPQNAEPKRYRFQPKCCKVEVNGSLFACAHPWEPVRELPLGNPITGREWDKDRPDPGSYPGGTFPEDGELGANGPGAGAPAVSTASGDTVASGDGDGGGAAAAAAASFGTFNIARR